MLQKTKQHAHDLINDVYELLEQNDIQSCFTFFQNEPNEPSLKKIWDTYQEEFLTKLAGLLEEHVSMKNISIFFDPKQSYLYVCNENEIIMKIFCKERRFLSLQTEAETNHLLFVHKLLFKNSYKLHEDDLENFQNLYQQLNSPWLKLFTFSKLKSLQYKINQIHKEQKKLVEKERSFMPQVEKDAVDKITFLTSLENKLIEIGIHPYATFHTHYRAFRGFEKPQTDQFLTEYAHSRLENLLPFTYAKQMRKKHLLLFNDSIDIPFEDHTDILRRCFHLDSGLFSFKEPENIHPLYVISERSEGYNTELTMKEWVLKNQIKTEEWHQNGYPPSPIHKTVLTYKDQVFSFSETGLFSVGTINT